MANLKNILINRSTAEKLFFLIAIFLLVLGALSTGLFGFELWSDTEQAGKISVVSFVGSISAFLIQLILINFEVKDSTEKIKDNYDSMKIDIERLVKDEGALGKFKKITEAQIWNLDGDIYGFNPNWALELKTNVFEVHDEIREVHYRRLENSKVKTIEYIFLEDYPNSELYFGSNYFLKFLDELKINHPQIGDYVHKYICWVIPQEKWTTDNEIKKLIEPFEDLIFIRGTRFEKQQVIVFYNNDTSIVNGTHSNYLELYGDNFFTRSLVDMFERLKVYLCGNACKCPYPKKRNGFWECGKPCQHECEVTCQEVYWDKTTKSHKLRIRKI